MTLKDPDGSNAIEETKLASGERDLRLAVVMTGGVSLCVWMGGVALELDYLRRKSEPYGDLLQSARANPVVDIIAGTSAGGLNGTLLASAIAGDSNLTGLGDVWFQLADFQGLLRKMNETGANSLLQGERVFRPEIRKVLVGLLEGAESSSPGELDPALHLLVTTTATVPIDVPYVDDQNTQFSEPSYQGLFHFVRNKDTNHFAQPRAAEALARAARSSASFPGAFEPSYVPIGQQSSTDPDMAPYVNFKDTSRYTLDGGLLDNDPLDVLLDAISSQPATEVIDRRILFVNPLGSLTKSPPETPQNESPRIFSVLKDTLLIPRQRSNVLLYNKLLLREGQSGKLQGFRKALFEGITTPEMAAKLSFAARQLEPTVISHRSRLRTRRGDDSSPETYEARQSLLIAQDLLQRVIRISRDSDLAQHRKKVTLALARAAPSTISVPAPSDPAPPDIAQILADTMTALDKALGSRMLPDSPAVGQLRIEVTGIRLLAEGRLISERQALSADDWSQALNDLGLLQSAVTDGDVHSSQRIGFIEVSAATTDTSSTNSSDTGQITSGAADSPSASPEFDVSTKLTGVQLAHFGAFYAESWRRNDWIWGRLDGSYRLIAMLTDPDFLLELGNPSYVTALLQTQLGADVDGNVLSEKLTSISQLRPGNDRDDAIANYRSIVTRPIWAKRRIEILREELPELIKSIDRDLQAGLVPTPALLAYLSSSPSVTSATGDEEVMTIWSECPIGEEKIGDQVRSAQLIKQATQAGAVAIETIQTAISWRAGRLALKPIYWTLRVCNALARPLSRLARWIPRKRGGRSTS